MQDLTGDEFDVRFTVIPDGRGEYVRPTADDIDTDSKHLWTVVDPDGYNNVLYAVSGLHSVNRVGFLLTEETWDRATTAIWFESHKHDVEEEL